MTYGALTPGDLAPFGDGRSRSFSQPVLCGAILALTSSVGLWMLYGHSAVDTSVKPEIAQLAPVQTTPIQTTPIHVTPVEVVGAPATKPRPVDVAPAVVPLRRYAAMLDPAFVGGARPVTFAQSAPLRSSFAPLRRGDVADATPVAAPRIEIPTQEAAAPQAAPQANTTVASIEPSATDIDDTPDTVDVPLPTPRPAYLLPNHADSPRGLARRLAEQPSEPTAPAAPTPPPAAAPAAPGQPSFFQKLFGGIAPRNALAYAAPEDGGLLGRPGGDQLTAVYDIAAHTVYLPDGSRLEAHSGLGASLDDPRSVTQRMRGATPPATYELTEREALFHGVRALRLTPVGGGTTYGRGGLLAHTFMLGPRGDSNGCVVFRNYKAFLAAYDRGVIRRLVVVSSLR